MMWKHERLSVQQRRQTNRREMESQTARRTVARRLRVLTRRHDDIRHSLLALQTHVDLREFHFHFAQFVDGEAVVEVPLEFFLGFLAGETVGEVFGEFGLVLYQTQKSP